MPARTKYLRAQNIQEGDHVLLKGKNGNLITWSVLRSQRRSAGTGYSNYPYPTQELLLTNGSCERHMEFRLGFTLSVRTDMQNDRNYQPQEEMSK